MYLKMGGAEPYILAYDKSYSPLELMPNFSYMLYNINVTNQIHKVDYITTFKLTVDTPSVMIIGSDYAGYFGNICGACVWSTASGSYINTSGTYKRKLIVDDEVVLTGGGLGNITQNMENVGGSYYIELKSDIIQPSNSIITSGIDADLNGRGGIWTEPKSSGYTIEIPINKSLEIQMSFENTRSSTYYNQYFTVGSINQNTNTSSSQYKYKNVKFIHVYKYKKLEID